MGNRPHGDMKKCRPRTILIELKQGQGVMRSAHLGFRLRPRRGLGAQRALRLLMRCLRRRQRRLRARRPLVQLGARPLQVASPAISDLGTSSHVQQVRGRS